MYRFVTFVSIIACIGWSLDASVFSWRNGGNGEYLTANPPLNWEDNILWETQLEGSSNASPILVGDKLFVCREPHTLICIDTSSGKLLWERDNDVLDFLGLTEEEKTHTRALQARDAELVNERDRVSGERYRLNRRLQNNPDNESLKKQLEVKEAELRSIREERASLASDPKVGSSIVPTHMTNGYTSFTPVSDGKRVYAAFGHGVLAAYDLEGNKVWGKRMERPNDALGRYQWGGSTSPVLVGGNLVVRFSDYTALDAETGQEVWRIPSEVVYGTPAVFSVENEEFIFTPRGEVIRATDGATLQTNLVALHEDHPWSVFNSPVVDGDAIYTARGRGYDNADGHAYSFQIPDSLEKMYASGLTEIWHRNIHKQRYYASPIVHEGLFYALSQDFVLTVLEADSGARVYERKITGLRGIAYPSLSLAGNALFYGSDDGTLVAIELGREYMELVKTKMDTFRSTPIFHDNVAYLRTYSELIAVGGE